MPSIFPALPWQCVATDLFEWKGVKYLLIVDYYSRFIEMAKLSGESSANVIRHTKSIFARHGVPQEVVSDNGPQFYSWKFKEFTRLYGFTHSMSNPRFPQSNGEAERVVKTVKGHLKKAEDPCLSMLAYRATPLQNGVSPVEMLMSRRLRTPPPMIQSQLKLSVPDYSVIVRREEEGKRKQKTNYDRRHRAQSLDPLLPGEQV